MMDIFEQLKEYVLVTNNGKGRYLTRDIEGVTCTVDTISFHYSTTFSAARATVHIRDEFKVITNMLDHLTPGIVTVLIIV